MIWADSSNIAFFNLPKPKIAKRNWLEVLRWQLDEFSAENLDDWHLVVVENGSTSETVTVIACPHSTMLEFAETYNGDDDRLLVADIFALPMLENCWSVLQQGDICKVRTSENRGFTVHKKLLYSILTKLDKQQTTAATADAIAEQIETTTDLSKPESLLLYQLPDAKSFKNNLGDIKLEIVAIDSLDELKINKKGYSKLNLFCHQYKKNYPYLKNLTKFASPSYYMVTICLVLLLIWSNILVNSNQKKVDTYKQSITSGFQSTFDYPLDKRFSIQKNIDNFIGSLIEISDAQRESVVPVIRKFDALLSTCNKNCKVVKITGDAKLVEYRIEGKVQQLTQIQAKAKNFILDGFSVQWGANTLIADDNYFVVLKIEKI